MSLHQRPFDLVKVAEALARDIAISNSRNQINELIDTTRDLVGEPAMFAVLRSALTTLVSKHLFGVDVVDRYTCADLTASATAPRTHTRPSTYTSPSIFDPESLR